MSKIKWYQGAIHLLVALAVVLAMVLAPLVPQGSPLSNVGPGVAQANPDGVKAGDGINVVNITWPTTANPVCVLPGGSLTVNWTYNTNCTSVCFSIRVYNGTTVIFENTAVNRTGLTPGVDNPFNETITINSSAPANCNYYNLTIIAGCPVLPTPPEDTEVNAIFVDNVTPTVDLTAPSADICTHENNVTITANVNDNCCLKNVTFWYNLNGAGWNLITYNNTGQQGTISVVWDITSLTGCNKNVTINATATDCCNNTFSDTIGNITIDHTLPVLTITSPTANTCVNGTWTVSANVTDNCTCVANVTFAYLLQGGNWTLIGTNTTACANDSICTRSVSWNTTALGVDYCNVTIRANATDCCGNSNSTTVGNISVNNELPYVILNEPVAGPCYSGNVLVNATAGGSPNVTKVDFYWFNTTSSLWVLIGTNTTNCGCGSNCTYSVSWNTTANISCACSVAINATATDWCGKSNSSVHNISVDNSGQGPVVSITSPLNDTCVNGTWTVSANVTDNCTCVKNVTFWYSLGGEDNWTLIGTNTTGCACNLTPPCSLSVPWDTTALNDTCNVKIRANATDCCGYYSLATVTNITINNNPPYVKLNEPTGCVYCHNVTLNATAGGSPNVINVTFWWRIGNGNWTYIGYNNTNCDCGNNCTYTLNWDTHQVPDSCNVTINATATDWCGKTNSSYYSIIVHNILNAPVRSSPSNGATIRQNNVTFSWTVPGVVVNPLFTITKFEKDNPTAQIIETLPDDGCFTNQTWSINETLFDDYWGWYVNVTDNCTGSNGTNIMVNATNNWYFRVAGGLQSPAVAVNVPNGGETWVAGSNHTITWSAIDDITPPGELIINIYYSSDGGTNWTAIATNETNDGAYPWNLTGLVPGCQYLVKVTATDANGFVGSDTSNDVFCIVAALQTTLTVGLSAPDEVTEGQSYIVTAVVTNTGGVNATNVTATIEITGAATSAANQTGLVNITAATIPAGSSAKAEWRVNCTGGEDANIAVSASGSNTNTAIVSVAVKQIPISPYLTVAVSAPDEVIENTTFMVTAVVTNEGQKDATGVVVGIKVVGDAEISGSPNQDIGPIAAGSSAEVEWRLNCTGGEDANIRVIAEGNNTNTAIASVAVKQIPITEPYLVVEVSAPSQPVLEGTNFTVTALIKNIGGRAASNVTATMNATGAVTPTSEVKPVITSIAAGNSVNKEFALQCTGETDANVVVTAVGTNTNTAQDSAAVTQIGIDAPYLTVEVSAPAQVNAGQSYYITAVITNWGAEAATNVNATISINGTAELTTVGTETNTIGTIGAGSSALREWQLTCTEAGGVNVAVTAQGNNTNVAIASAAVRQIAAPCDVWVSIPDAAVGNTSINTTVPINITGVSELASATIWLHYNSSVVWVTNVTAGNLGGTITYSMNNATGLTKMAWFSATGKTGDFVFAYVTLRAVGSRGDTSPLNLDVKVLTDTAGDDIACCVDDGEFMIGLMEGDVTLDGCVNIVDAMFIAQWVVGLRTLSADQRTCADTFDDGNVDISDAMHIAQWVVDPDGTLGVLLVPLWAAPADNNMLHPHAC